MGSSRTTAKRVMKAIQTRATMTSLSITLSNCLQISAKHEPEEESAKMNSLAPTLTRLTPAPFANRRLEREWKTVSAMVHIYCRDQHHGDALCEDCQQLMSYIRLRLERCRFGEDKPTCAKCPVHCYQKDRRAQIKTVMRFAGPKMVWEHPWLSLCHVLDGWFRRA